MDVELAPFIDGLALVQREQRFSWSRWISYKGGEVYIRIYPRSINEDRTLVVDIANVNWPAALQRKGHFTALLRDLRCCTALPLHVENLTVSRTGEALIRMGFVRTTSSGLGVNYLLVGPLSD